MLRQASLGALLESTQLTGCAEGQELLTLFLTWSLHPSWSPSYRTQQRWLQHGPWPFWSSLDSCPQNDQYPHRTCRGCYPNTFCARLQLASHPYQALLVRSGLELEEDWLLVTFDKPDETTLGENTKDPTTRRDSERIGVERLGQRPKMSSNGEPLGAGLHCIYTTLHEGYARLSMRLRTVQCYASDVIVELRLCGMTSREAACTS